MNSGKLIRVLGIITVSAVVVNLAIFWYIRKRDWMPGTYDGRHFGMPPTRYELQGTAAGGVVCLLGPTRPQFASVQTTQGESAETVLKRLAAEIEKLDPFCWRSDPYGGVTTYSGHPPSARAEGNTLTMPGAWYGFSGSDSGFKVPKPILSVSGWYDPIKKQIALFWINPSDRYDEISADGKILRPGSTNCVLERKSSAYESVPPATVGVFVRRGKMTSLPAELVLALNSQEELEAYPFYMGVAPNWSAWSNSTKPDEINFEQGTKPAVPLRLSPTTAVEKPFYQIIKTTHGDVQGGVWRRFLGLSPGHTYKVKVRLNTLQMDANTNTWAFSFHAAYDNPGGAGLTTHQMVGTAALPDRSSGPAAGRVTLYGPGATTRGQWVERSTDEPDGSLKNITLPRDVTSITVWLRHSGSSSSGVGMDWIKLEDVSLIEK